MNPRRRWHESTAILTALTVFIFAFTAWWVYRCA